MGFLAFFVVIAAILYTAKYLHKRLGEIEVEEKLEDIESTHDKYEKIKDINKSEFKKEKKEVDKALDL